MRNTWKQFVILLLAAAFGSVLPLNAQHYPEVPAQVPFGGINVRLDNSARSIIASDIKVLMINQKYWEEKLERALLYFPIIEGVFIDEEVPIDFKYLAAQESSLIPDAVSSSKAVGFWQFKDATARELGLRVDNHVDERKNISASTRAAAAYLKRSNQTYNNWVSSLFSYYLGISGVQDKIPDNWANAHDISLTGRADRYVLRFFAYKIAFEAGLDRYRSKNAITLVEAPIGKGRRLEEISNELKISVSDLKGYNRWLNGNSIPTDKDYFLTIPVASSKVQNVRENLSLVQSDNTLASKYDLDDIGYPILKKSARQPSGNNPHTLYDINGLPGILGRAGDYPNSLARAGKVSASKFRKFNDMDVSMTVVPGEVYYLARKNRKAAVAFHSVRDGETPHSISQLYGMRLKDLLRYNRITSRNAPLETGRQMWLTKRRPASIPVKVIDTGAPVRPYTPPAAEAPEPIADYTPKETTPTPAGNDEPAREVAAEATKTVSSAAPVIPRNPSERRRYTPKLADKPSAEPSAVEQPAPLPTAPSTASSRRVETPEEEVTTTAEIKTPETRSNNRIVIVREDAPAASAGTPRPRQEDAKPAYSPPPSAGATNNTTAATTSPVPAKTEPVVSKPAVATAHHTVEKGETFYSISKKYEMTITELLTLNNMTISDNLPIGQRLMVSQAAGVSSVAPAAPAQPVVHAVVKGETLFSISKKYNTTIQALKTFNNLTVDGVKIGQKLKIPSN